MKWEDLSFSSELLCGIYKQRWSHPSPELCCLVEHARVGHDVLHRSKHLDYVQEVVLGTLSVVEQCITQDEQQDDRPSRFDGTIKAVVLTSRREHAFILWARIQEVAPSIETRLCVKDNPLPPAAADDAVDVLVGTPGTVWDNVRRRKLSVKGGVTLMVLCELDDFAQFQTQIIVNLHRALKPQQLMLHFSEHSAEVQWVISKLARRPIDVQQQLLNLVHPLYLDADRTD